MSDLFKHSYKIYLLVLLSISSQLSYAFNVYDIVSESQVQVFAKIYNFYNKSSIPSVEDLNKTFNLDCENRKRNRNDSSGKYPEIDCKANDLKISSISISYDFGLYTKPLDGVDMNFRSDESAGGYSFIEWRARWVAGIEYKNSMRIYNNSINNMNSEIWYNMPQKYDSKKELDTFYDNPSNLVTFLTQEHYYKSYSIRQPNISIKWKTNDTVDSKIHFYFSQNSKMPSIEAVDAYNDFSQIPTRFNAISIDSAARLASINTGEKVKENFTPYICDKDGNCSIDKLSLAKINDAKKAQATALDKFRKALKSGQVTNCGTVIDSKANMIYVQTGSDAGAVWIAKQFLYPQYDESSYVIGCKDSNRWYKRYGNWVSNNGNQFTKNGTNYIDY